MKSDLSSPASESTSTSLIARLRQRDNEAWRQVVDAYGPVLFAWAQRCGLQGTDAADVVQEMFQAIASKIATFRRENAGDTFRGWLWTITRNKVNDHFRRLAAHPGQLDQSRNEDALVALPAAPPEESTLGLPRSSTSVLASAALAGVQAEFESRTWQAFWRVVVEGQKPSDVAGDLGVSLASVYMAKSRVMRRLREVLAGLLDDGEPPTK